jgi:hypothetical protein
MKNLKFALLALVAMPVGHAATTLTSNGSNPTSQGWTLATSGNAGQFSSANPNFNGGSSSVVAGNAWGLYANGGGVGSLTYSTGDLTGAGGHAAYIALSVDNGGINNGNSVAVQFFDGATLAFEFKFNGGATFWQFGDSNGFNQNTSSPFTFNGSNYQFEQTGLHTYTFKVNGSQVASGTLAGSAGYVDSVRVLNSNSGSDVVFNTLVYQVPEPSTALFGALGLLVALRRRR